MFSVRTDLDYQPNQLTLLRQRLEAEPGGLMDLTVTNPTRVGLFDDQNVLFALTSREGLIYEVDPMGLAVARQAVARMLEQQGHPVPWQQLCLTASTSEAYAFLFKLLADPGDEVLAPRPSYPLFEHLARLEGIRTRFYDLEYDGAWHVDLESVRCRLGPRTRAILVVSPNHPTGSCCSRQELDGLAALGKPLIVDEVFFDQPWGLGPSRACSALELGDAPVFVLGGLSKSVALPQLKLAWTAVKGRPAFVEEALVRWGLIADTFLSVSTPVQHGLAPILAEGAARREAVLGRLRANLGTLKNSCQGTTSTLLTGEAGWSAVLRLPRIKSEQAYVMDLLEQDHVLVQPGFFYDFCEEAYVIVSLLPRPEVFAEAIRRLVRRVDAVCGPGTAPSPAH